MSADARWLHDSGFPLVRAAADFWASRVRERAGVAHIDHVYAERRLEPEASWLAPELRLTPFGPGLGEGYRPTSTRW